MADLHGVAKRAGDRKVAGPWLRSIGLARPRQLSDLVRLDADLKVRCAACGRVAIFDVRRVSPFFRTRGWNMA